MESVLKRVKIGPQSETITNESGGKQSDLGVRLDLVPPRALLAEAQVLKAGADKYGVGNWKYIKIDDHLNHALAHIYAFLMGDRSEHHIANLACRAHFALEILEEELEKYESKYRSGIEEKKI